jgi:Sulfotransferase domain
VVVWVTTAVKPAVKPVIVLWAHSRSASTAFVRMMIERGDVAVLHEPFLALTEGGEVPVPGLGCRPGGAPAVARSGRELVGLLADLARVRPVFVKEVLDYRYDFAFGHPDELAWLTHTFLVRDPRQAISSHYAMKPTVTCPEIGYEWLWELFQLIRSATGRPPLVIRSEDLLRDPAGAVGAYCQAVGLPFLASALHWDPGERPEWQRHRAWHLDAIRSSGFASADNAYPVTVDNHPVLRSFYDHHYPFYQRIVQYAR